jgi:tetratricopeptide (TPR) repeat protein
MKTLTNCYGMAFAVFLAIAPQSAQSALWCAAYRNGGNNCGFYTYDQCLAAVSGIGGFCNKSPENASERATQRSKTPAKQEKRTVARQPAAPSSAPKEVAPAATATPTANVASPTASKTTSVVTTPNGQAFVAARQLILAGQYDAGLSAMQALRSDNHPDVASYIGLAHRKLGRNEEAKSWYDKALVADPKHLQTLAFYGVLRVEQGDIAGARTDLQKIRSICGNTSCNEYVGLAGIIAAKSQ